MDLKYNITFLFYSFYYYKINKYKIFWKLHNYIIHFENLLNLFTPFRC